MHAAEDRLAEECEEDREDRRVLPSEQGQRDPMDREEREQDRHDVTAEEQGGQTDQPQPDGHREERPEGADVEGPRRENVVAPVQRWVHEGLEKRDRDRVVVEAITVSVYREDRDNRHHSREDDLGPSRVLRGPGIHGATASRRSGARSASPVWKDTERRVIQPQGGGKIEVSEDGQERALSLALRRETERGLEARKSPTASIIGRRRAGCSALRLS